MKKKIVTIWECKGMTPKLPPDSFYSKPIKVEDYRTTGIGGIHGDDDFDEKPIGGFHD